MSKKNKTVQQIKAESKNKQTTTKKKNRREISDCRKKRIYPSTRISKFLFALPDRLRRNSTFVRKSYRKISEINKKVNTKKKKEKKRKTREIRDSWKKNNRLHWAFSDFFSSFFFDRMSCFHLFFHTRRPQQLHTDLLGLLGLRLEIPTDLLKKKEGENKKEIYSNPPRR